MNVDALPDVLATITDVPAEAWRRFRNVDVTDKNVVLVLRKHERPYYTLYKKRDARIIAALPAEYVRNGPRDTVLLHIPKERRRLTVRDPREALERLETRMLYPFAVGDASAPRWHCDRCGGTGSYGLGAMLAICPWCNPSPTTRFGYTIDPTSMASVVSVAAVGRDNLLRAASLAGELTRGTATVVWRVMDREALREWHKTHAKDAPPCGTFSREMIVDAEYSRSGYGDLPWQPCGDVTRSVNSRTWNVLLALRTLRVHPLSVKDGVVVLGIEAIGGGT